MDNKQAAETLRTVAQCDHELTEAVTRGADAIEMLEWLLDLCDPYMRARARLLYDEWLDDGDTKKTFRAFCEAKFRERAR